MDSIRYQRNLSTSVEVHTLNPTHPCRNHVALNGCSLWTFGGGISGNQPMLTWSSHLHEECFYGWYLSALNHEWSLTGGTTQTNLAGTVVSFQEASWSQETLSAPLNFADESHHSCWKFQPSGSGGLMLPHKLQRLSWNPAQSGSLHHEGWSNAFGPLALWKDEVDKQCRLSSYGLSQKQRSGWPRPSLPLPHVQRVLRKKKKITVEQDLSGTKRIEDKETYLWNYQEDFGTKRRTCFSGPKSSYPNRVWIQCK